MNRAGFIIFGDFIAFLISFLLLIFFFLNGQNHLDAIHSHTIPFIILYLSWVLIFYVFGLYDLLSIKPTIPYLKRWIMALVCSFGVGILLFYFVPIFGISPKINLIIQVTGFGLFSFLFRRIIYSFFSKTITRPAILVGSSFYLNELEKTIYKNPQIGLQIIGHFQSIDNIDIDNKNNLLIILDKDIKIHDQNILDFYKKNIEVIDTAKAYEKYLYKIPVGYIDLPFIIKDIGTRKEIFYTSMAFVLDKVFALVILIISLPFTLISMMLVHLYDKGPVFYGHNRVGLNGKIFKLYKIRSMNIDAEKNGVKWTEYNDPRITPIGKVIRKIHIDEVPQMISILKGDMSLVGPRPERPEFVELLSKEIPYYPFRHIIKPGFTGWAQIKFQYARTNDESKEKFEYDLYYIKNRNIFFDFGIIIRTIQIIFTH